VLAVKCLSILCACAFLFTGAPSPVHAVSPQFTGQVVGIIDGDTIDVLHNGQAERIRLNGIDCPEKKQPYGTKAKQFTSSLVFGKQVTVKPLKKDRHGRTVADVLLPDGTNVSHELVKAGFAWWYKQYARHDETLAELEGEAREQKRGLWADAHPVPPWEVRHPRSVPSKPTDVATLMDREQSAKEPGQEVQQEPADSTPVPIIGNRKSKIYERPDCPNYTATAPKNRVMFKSAAEAEQAGYRLAKTCPTFR
jgi:endonuclease YncB( thermonuclease family)